MLLLRLQFLSCQESRKVEIEFLLFFEMPSGCNDMKLECEDKVFYNNSICIPVQLGNIFNCSQLSFFHWFIVLAKITAIKVIHSNKNEMQCNAIKYETKCN